MRLDSKELRFKMSYSLQCSHQDFASCGPRAHIDKKSGLFER